MNRLLSAYGNLMYGDSEADELGRGMGVKVDMGKLTGDDKASERVKSMANELGLL